MFGEEPSYDTAETSSLDHQEESLSAAFDDYVGAYFSTPRRKGLLHQLIYLAQFGDGIQVVQGEKGSGKSAFSHELKANITNTEYVAWVQVQEDSSSSEILEDILKELGVRVAPTATEGEAISALRHFSQSLITERRHAVLIIDDAHRLEDFALAAIASIRQGDESAGSGLHLVFFAEPGLALRLDAAELIDVPAHDFDMPLFSNEELAEFFKYRLQVQGYPTSFPFASDSMRSFWAQSGGSPGIALALAREYLSGLNKPKSMLKLPLPIGHLAALCLLVGVLIWALMARDSEKSVTTVEVPVVESQPKEMESVPVEENAAVNKVVAEQAPVISDPVDNQLSTEDPLSEEEPIREYIAEDISVPEPAPLMEESSVKDDPLIPKSMRSTADEIKSTKTNSPSKENEQAEAESLLSEMAEESASLNQELEDSIQPPVLAEPVSRAEVKTPVLSPKVNTVADNELSTMEAKLMAAPPEQYTLQVIAASSKPALEEFINRQANRDQLLLYRGEREGKRWYIVVAGLYNNRKAALAAINTLPPAQKSAGPWPKRIETIQEEITLIRSN